MDEFITKSSQKTEELGMELGKKMKPQDVIFLIGDLGSGKTTFVKGLAASLGVTTRIISPTFVIARQHEVEGDTKSDIRTLYHLDLYRLANEKEAKSIDLKDFLNDKNGIVVIEWPEISQNIVDKKVWKIEFQYMHGDERKITVRYE